LTYKSNKHYSLAQLFGGKDIYPLVPLRPSSKIIGRTIDLRTPQESRPMVLTTIVALESLNLRVQCTSNDIKLIHQISQNLVQVITVPRFHVPYVFSTTWRRHVVFSIFWLAYTLLNHAKLVQKLFCSARWTEIIRTERFYVWRQMLRTYW